MVIEYFFKAYTPIYFTILSPFLNIWAASSFSLSNSLMSIFLYMAFSIFQGIFLG